MWYVGTYICVVSEKIIFSTKVFLILLMSNLLSFSKFPFFAKIVPLLKAIV